MRGTSIAGKARALAMMSKERVPGAEEVPTIVESGGPLIESSSWVMFMAPAKTPKDIVDKLAGAVEKVATSADYKQKILEQGAYATFMGPKELGEFTKTELAYWGEVINKAGITLDQ